MKVHLFGKPHDWSIAPLREEEDAKKQPELMDRIRDATLSLCPEDWFETEPDHNPEGIDSVFLLAPRPTEFNAVICDPWRDLKVEMVSGPLLPCHFCKVTIKRGCNADGVEIPKNLLGGFWLSSADCLCVVAFSPSGRLICAHAGRDSLFDRKKMLTGTPSRKNESVVDSIAELLGTEFKETKFFLTCGIAPEHLVHSWYHLEHGATNEKMIKYLAERWEQSVPPGKEQEGWINLKGLVTSQFEEHGVSANSISTDGVDTYGDAGSDGRPLWWSHRRGDGAKRNGILVIRK